MDINSSIGGVDIKQKTIDQHNTGGILTLNYLAHASDQLREPIVADIGGSQSMSKQALIEQL